MPKFLDNLFLTRYANGDIGDILKEGIVWHIFKKKI